VTRGAEEDLDALPQGKQLSTETHATYRHSNVQHSSAVITRHTKQTSLGNEHDKFVMTAETN